MNKSLDKMDALKLMADNEHELKRIAESPDGEKLKKMVNQDVIKAAQNGDSEALKSFISSILSTDEGVRLAQKLSQLGGSGVNGR